MNGRGGKQFLPNRAEYWSYDDGTTWSLGSRSELEDDDGEGCERSVVNVGNRLYTLEPLGKQRTGMVLQCSTDHGKSWPRRLSVNGDYRGGYSALIGINNTTLLAVWEDGSHPLGSALAFGEDPDSGNFFVQQLSTTFCTE